MPYENKTCHCCSKLLWNGRFGMVNARFKFLQCLFRQNSKYPEWSELLSHLFQIQTIPKALRHINKQLHPPSDDVVLQETTISRRRSGSPRWKFSCGNGRPFPSVGRRLVHISFFPCSEYFWASNWGRVLIIKTIITQPCAHLMLSHTGRAFPKIRTVQKLWKICRTKLNPGNKLVCVFFLLEAGFFISKRADSVRWLVFWFVV